MNLSKYSKEEIYSKLVEALKIGANHLENAKRLTDENNELRGQLSKHPVGEGKLTLHQLSCNKWMVKCEMADILTEGTKEECDDFVKGWLEAERSVF